MQIVLRDNDELNFPLGGDGCLITMECFNNETGATELWCRAKGSNTVLAWATIICKTVYDVELEERNDLYDPGTCQCRKFFIAPLEKLQIAYGRLMEQGVDVIRSAETAFADRMHLHGN